MERNVERDLEPNIDPAVVQCGTLAVLGVAEWLLDVIACRSPQAGVFDRSQAQTATDQSLGFTKPAAFSSAPGFPSSE